MSLDVASFMQRWRLDPSQTALGVEEAVPVTKYSGSQQVSHYPKHRKAPYYFCLSENPPIRQLQGNWANAPSLTSAEVKMQIMFSYPSMSLTRSIKNQ